jgi:hypothetical protein
MGDYTSAERQRRYIQRLKAKAATREQPPEATHPDWEVIVDDEDGEGYLAACEGPYTLYVHQLNKVWWWYVLKDVPGDAADPIDVAEGEAPSLLAAMAASEVAIRS